MFESPAKSSRVLRIALTAALTVVACVLIGASTGFGSSDQSRGQIGVMPGNSFNLAAIGWSCQYGVTKKGAGLTCTPNALGSSTQGDPIIALTKQKVSLLGLARPHLESLATPKCCLRIWSFPVQHGLAKAGPPSDADLIAGDSISVPSLDLMCRVLKSDPDKHETGPVFICFRQSSTGKQSPAEIEASRFHMKVAPSNAKYWGQTVTRTP